MKCGYCGHEFSQEEGITGCGKCGKPMKCRMVRCPRCYYENPPELTVVKKIKEILTKNDKH
ncbi:hypothetical protein [Geotalea sp. SG265]|uniref:hypothetical protein n=1 Tax=Geotalea sp. SG265 TaxID=2922867 RepID=UPI001FAFB697|nr:hypothetical protein [Geotalea sp. SG265]